MRKLNTIDFHSKLDAAYKKHREAVRVADEAMRYEVALIEIQHNGPNWLVTGKCGGWDDEDGPWPVEQVSVRKLSHVTSFTQAELEDQRYYDEAIAQLLRYPDSTI